MKQSVQVNGVVLTREQVETALRELDTPDVPPASTLVEWNGRRCVVTGLYVEDVLSAEYGRPLGETFRITDGCSSWVVHPHEVTVLEPL